jgi:hypothetical protein
MPRPLRKYGNDEIYQYKPRTNQCPCIIETSIFSTLLSFVVNLPYAQFLHYSADDNQNMDRR